MPVLFCKLFTSDAHADAPGRPPAMGGPGPPDPPSLPPWLWIQHLPPGVQVPDLLSPRDPPPPRYGGYDPRYGSATQLSPMMGGFVAPYAGGYQVPTHLVTFTSKLSPSITSSIFVISRTDETESLVGTGGTGGTGAGRGTGATTLTGRGVTGDRGECTW